MENWMDDMMENWMENSMENQMESLMETLLESWMEKWMEPLTERSMDILMATGLNLMEPLMDLLCIPCIVILMVFKQTVKNSSCALR